MKKHLSKFFIGAVLLALSISLNAAESSRQKDQTPLGRLVAIQKALAADSLEHVAHHAKAIEKAAANHEVHGLPHIAAKQAAAVAEAKDIKAAREAFKKLNESFVAWLKAHPGEPGEYKVAYCPMAEASWVQTGDSIANPYFGKSMLKCGTFKK